MKALSIHSPLHQAAAPRSPEDGSLSGATGHSHGEPAADSRRAVERCQALSLALCLGGLLVLSGCRAGGGDLLPGVSGVDGLGDLKPSLGVDLANVQGLVLAAAPASAQHPLTATVAGAGTTSPNSPQAPRQVLHALLASGELQEVTASTNPDANPLALYDTPKYLLVAYQGVFHQGTPCRLVPIRKSDGAMFCVDASISTDMNVGQWEDRPVQTDGSGEVLFVLDKKLSKIDLRDPEHPLETVLATSDNGSPYLWRMVVNDDGDVLLGEGDALRLYLASGELQPITGRRVSCPTRGPRTDNTSFYFIYDEAPLQGEVHHLAKRPDGRFEEQPYAALSSLPNGCHSFYRMEDRVLIKSIVPGATFVELINPSRSPASKTVPLSGGSPSSVNLIPSGATLIAWSQESISRYELASEATQLLLAPGTYRLSSLDVGSGGELSFSGTRLADGARVLGSVSAQGTTVSVVNERAPEVRSIVRIR